MVKRVTIEHVNEKKHDHGKKRWDGMVSKSKRKQSLSTIWTQLPEDTYSILFCHTPLPALCRFRCVCKNWNAQIVNKCKGTWFIRPVVEELKNDGTCTLGFSLMEEGCRSWRKLSLHIELPDSDYLNVFYDTSVSSNGLVCIHSIGYDGCAIICNPFNKWFAQLPPLPHVPHELSSKVSRDSYIDPVIFIAVQECLTDSTGFIVACLVERKSLTWLEPILHVYTSSNANWVASNAIPFGGEGGEIILSCYSSCFCMALSNNHLYLISMTPDDTCSLKSLNVFDPCQDVKCLATWTKFSWQPGYEVNMTRNRGQRLNFQGRGYVQPRFVLCENKFMLVMLVPLEEGSRWGTACIYTLEEESKKWEEISRLPIKMLPARNKRGLNLDLVDYVAVGGKNQVTMYFNRTDWGCVYDVLSGKWYSVFGQGKSGGIFFSFQPSLLTYNV